MAYVATESMAAGGGGGSNISIVIESVK